VAVHCELDPDEFDIYVQVPRPKDFLNLPNSRERWRAAVDRVERQKDTGDNADDWNRFDRSIPNGAIATRFMSTRHGRTLGEELV